MKLTEQAELDFSEERHRFYLLEEAARVEFSEENLCLCWVTDSDGRHWKDWWDSQPGYKRRGMLNHYRFERDAADRMRAGAMRPYRDVVSEYDEAFRHERNRVAHMAQEIRDAAVEQRPVPFREHPDSSGMEKLKFRIRLSQAFSEAGVLIINQSPTP